MLNKNRKQSGVTLLEMVLGLAIIGIIFAFLTKYIFDSTKELRFQGVSKQIEALLEDAKNLVKQDFNNYYTAAYANSDLLVNIDLSDIYQYNSSDLIKYDAEAPLGGTYLAFVRIPYDTTSTTPEKSLQVILYLLNNQSDVTWLDAQKIARNIKDGQGGIIYGATSPLSPCSGNLCVANAFGTWVVEDAPNRAIMPLDIASQISAFSPSYLAPGIAAIATITESESAGEYLSREENANNPSQNTMSTDLNIDDFSDSESNSALFFNGLEDTAGGNSLVGVNLSYQGDFGNPSISAPGFTLENNDSSATAQPMFISNGGLKTNLQVNEGAICNTHTQKHLLAADATTGHILSCHPLEEDSVLTLSGSGDFPGNWEKVDWKRSLYMLDKNIVIAVGFETNVPPGDFISQENLNLILGDEISSKAEFLILSSYTSGKGLIWASALLGGYDYQVLYNQNTINQVQQAIIPYAMSLNPTDTNFRILAEDISALPGETIDFWSVSVIGYIDID